MKHFSRSLVPALHFPPPLSRSYSCFGIVLSFLYCHRPLGSAVAELLVQETLYTHKHTYRLSSIWAVSEHCLFPLQGLISRLFSAQFLLTDSACLCFSVCFSVSFSVSAPMVSIFSYSHLFTFSSCSIFAFLRYLR